MARVPGTDPIVWMPFPYGDDILNSRQHPDITNPSDTSTGYLFHINGRTFSGPNGWGHRLSSLDIMRQFMRCSYCGGHHN